MVTHLCLGVILLTVAATATANTDIHVECLRDAVRVTWTITPELAPYASRHFLGTCTPSRFSQPEEGGGGQVIFDYKLGDCRFRRLLKGKRLIYENDMLFRPQAKYRAPAAYTYPIQCVYRRPEGWIPPFLAYGTGGAVGHGGLVFHMALLNEQLSGVASSNIIPLGSFIPLWAAVEQKDHQPLLLLMEECVATSMPELRPDSPVYPIITNKGCLVDGRRGVSRFLPRYHSSAVILYLQSFKFPPGEEVYIHCKLVVSDPGVFNEGKKACHYTEAGWELLDDPFQNALCSCCDSSCRPRVKRGAGSASPGLVQNTVLGPLIIVDPSAARSHNDTRAVSVKLLTAEMGTG